MFSSQRASDPLARRVLVAGLLLLAPMWPGRTAAEQMPQLGPLADGQVLCQVAENLPSHTRWLNAGERWPEAETRLALPAFLLPRLPLRYDTGGIRDSWQAPVLVRLAGDVTLPPGRHRLLLRARGLARLWVDGHVVARTTANTKSPPDGEEPVTPVAQPPLPGLRPHGYHQQEVTAELEVPEGEVAKTRVVLECVAGGTNLRTETGEVCIAVQWAGEPTYRLLQPEGAGVVLSDQQVWPVLDRTEQLLAEEDDRARARLRPLTMRSGSSGTPGHGSGRPNIRPRPFLTPEGIRSMLLCWTRSSARAAAQQEDGRWATRFHEEVLPLLRTACFRCHGEKDAGGLRLNNRQALLQGGDSGAVVVPGDVEASELMARVREEDEDLRMPPAGPGLSADQIELLAQWIAADAPWPAAPVAPEQLTLAAVVEDQAFIRRVFLDLVGVPPTANQVVAFVRDRSENKRARLVDQLLDDPRYADHWVSYWQDLLAENPTLLNLSLNSTGPFRWFLHDALRDHKPLDRMITELIELRGSAFEGGSAGFGVAAENDAPYAAKGHILASAFLGIELQCAALPRFSLPQHDAARSVRAGRHAPAQYRHSTHNQSCAGRIFCHQVARTADPGHAAPG